MKDGWMADDNNNKVTQSVCHSNSNHMTEKPKDDFFLAGLLQL